MKKTATYGFGPLLAMPSPGKLVLGVCLGAQLIADVLGGPVSKNNLKRLAGSRFPVPAPASPFHNFPLNS
jgi:GMP synthase-like glutamine amidotransferase